MKPTELCNIMAEEGSDKSDILHKHHNYTTEYWSLLNSKKDDIKNVFELGLGTNYTDVASSMGTNGIPGASLRGWRRFFKNATIYGADIDKRILFNEDRIKTFFVDQTNKNSIIELWENEDLQHQFDIIIDDGLHEINANLIFLENSFHKLNNNSIYIIEDINIHHIPEYKNKLTALQKKYDFNFTIKNLEHHTNKQDNCFILIQNNV
jgi:hypothetical protein